MVPSYPNIFILEIPITHNTNDCPYILNGISILNTISLNTDYLGYFTHQL